MTCQCGGVLFYDGPAHALDDSMSYTWCDNPRPADTCSGQRIMLAGTPAEDEVAPTMRRDRTGIWPIPGPGTARIAAVGTC